MIATWALQGGTAWNRPDETARSRLIQSLKEQVRPKDEIVFLPEWEWGWAHRLYAVLEAPTLRLGREDLYRPHRGLWVIQGPNAEMVFDHVGTLETDQAFGPYRLAYFAGEPQAEPLLQSIAWGNCRTNRRRSTCRQKQGELRRGEVIFDGRFAHGYKLKLPPNGKATLIIDPKNSSTIVGGIGHTDHGARHGQAPVQLAIRQGSELLFRYAYKPQTGLRPFRLQLDNKKPLQFEFSTTAPDRNEMALSLGRQ